MDETFATHVIYFTDYSFTNIISDDEQMLIDTNEDYRNTRNHILKSISSKSYDRVSPEEFSGLVRYIPTNENKDIKESADIILYVFYHKKINKNAYKSAMEILRNFINTNKIDVIKITGYDDDCKYLMNSKVDPYNDLITCESLKLIEV